MPEARAGAEGDPQAYCTALTRASGSNFYYAFLPLPRRRRDALFVIYAFCRFADDIVDEEPDRARAAALLAAWRQECAAALAGHATHPITQRLAEVVAEFRINPALPFDLLDGMAMDLEPVHYADFAALRAYCYRVASVVGMMCVPVFGCAHPDAMRFADAHGMAFQLTNILRDVAKDARNGRVYLPQDDLARFGVTIDDLARGRYTPGFRALMLFQCERARGYYREARAIARSLPAADRGALLPSRIMGAIYGALLDEMAEREFRTVAPVSLSTPCKLYLAARAWLDHLADRW
ncbi:MAG: presqualene diphosphate synthase HpnD [Nitrospirae bacterium]|nr:presqualene diphosphate synthase HpnD [Nitrospirota bacterium]